jgi:hypothetical protein
MSKCLSIKNRNASGCFNSHSPDLYNSLIYTTSTEVPHAILALPKPLLTYWETTVDQRVAAWVGRLQYAVQKVSFNTPRISQSLFFAETCQKNLNPLGPIALHGELRGSHSSPQMIQMIKFGGTRNAYKNVVGKSAEKISLWRLKHRPRWKERRAYSYSVRFLTRFGWILWSDSVNRARTLGFP